MRTRISIVLAAALAVLAVAAPAQAKPVSSDGLRDGRYCEIFTVTLDPSPLATIWNSYGLGTCPQAWWSALDPPTVAAEQGVPAVVLNGPRAWVMDRVSVKNPGPVRDSRASNCDRSPRSTCPKSASRARRPTPR